MYGLILKLLARFAPVIPDTVSIATAAGENGLIAGVIYAAAATGAITMDAFEEIKTAKDDDEKIELCITHLVESKNGIENASKTIEFFEKNGWTNEAIKKAIAEMSHSRPERLHLQFYSLLCQIKAQKKQIGFEFEKLNIEINENIEEMLRYLTFSNSALTEISSRLKELLEKTQTQNAESCDQLKLIEKRLKEIRHSNIEKNRFTNRFTIDLRDMTKKRLSNSVKKVMETLYLKEMNESNYDINDSTRENGIFKDVVDWAFLKASQDLLETTLERVVNFDDMELNANFYSELISVEKILRTIQTRRQLPKFDENFSIEIDKLAKAALTDTSLFSRDLTHLICREISYFLSTLPRITSVFIAATAKSNMSFLSHVEKTSQGSTFLKKIKLAEPNEKENILYQVEDVYFSNLVFDLDYVQILGIKINSRQYTRYMLTNAYIRLTIANGGEDVHTERELARNKFILLRGSAGSGKSTLLQWIAVGCVKGFDDDVLNELSFLVPVFIKLKDYRNQPFPRLLEAARKYQGNAIFSEFENWFHMAADAGRIILLCDGIDEVAESKRYEFENWLRNIIFELKGKIRVIVTGRPTAISRDLFFYSRRDLNNFRDGKDVVKRIASTMESDTPGDIKRKPPDDTGAGTGRGEDHTVASRDLLSNFRIYDVQPMNRTAVFKFVEKWHESCSLNTDRDKAEKVKALAEPLKNLLSKSRSLFDLCSRPLVCAMVCFLHHSINITRASIANSDFDEMVELPKRHIYEQCADAMIFWRDNESEVDLSQYPKLDKDQRYNILGNVAQWIFQNGESHIKEHQIARVIENEKTKFKFENQYFDIRKAVKLITERTLLQSTGEDEYEFLHKSFLEFFCARYFNDMDCGGILIKNCENPDWEEVIVLYCGIVGTVSVSKFIDKIVDKAFTTQEPLRLLLLAAACKENSLSVLPGVVEKLTQKISLFLPPNNLTVAARIAKIGIGLVNQLALKREFSQVQRVACIRALSLIGGDRALSELLKYARNPNITRKESRELLRSCELNQEYAQSLASLIDLHIDDHVFQDGDISLQSFSELGGMVFTDLEAFYRCLGSSSLRRITIESLNGESSLDFLEVLNRKVTHMRFGNCWHLRDLTFLRQFPNLMHLELLDIQSLQITGEIADLAGLRFLKCTGCNSLVDIRPLVYMSDCRIVLENLNQSCYVPSEFHRSKDVFIKPAR
jgi:hypothetical protein